MDDMQGTGIIEQIFDALVNRGISSGLIIFVMGFVIYRLDKRIEALNKLVADIGRESTAALSANAAAFNRQTDLLLDKQRGTNRD